LFTEKINGTIACNLMLVPDLKNSTKAQLSRKNRVRKNYQEKKQ
jgi:hypothetical protein